MIILQKIVQTEMAIIKIISIPWAVKRCSWKKWLHDQKKQLENDATLSS